MLIFVSDSKYIYEVNIYKLKTIIVYKFQLHNNND